MTDIDTLLKIVKEIAGLTAAGMVIVAVVMMFWYLRSQAKILQQAMTALGTAQNTKDDIESLTADSKTMVKTLQDVAGVIPASMQVMTDLHQLIINFTGKQDAVLTENQNQTTALAALAQDQEAGLNSLGVKMNEIQTDVHNGYDQVIAELQQIKEILRNMVDTLKPALETLESTASKITSEQPAAGTGVTIEEKQSDSEESKS